MSKTTMIPCKRRAKLICMLLSQCALFASPSHADCSTATLTSPGRQLPCVSSFTNKAPSLGGTSAYGQEEKNTITQVRAIRSGATASSAENRFSQCTRRRLTVLLVATALFNDMLQLTMLLPIIHTLVTSPPPLGVEGNSELALGVFFASKDICQMAMAPVAGILTSKTSPNVALLLSTVGLGLATAVFAEATTFWQLLFARGAQGAASAAVMCGGMSLIAETHSTNIRGSAIGLAQTGLAGGLLCGPLIGGLLFERLGRKQTFRLAAMIVLANAFAQLILMSFAPPERHILSDADKEGGQKKKNAKEMNLLSSSRLLLTNCDILAVAASTFAIHAVVGVIKPLSQVVLDREFGVSMVHRSIIISIATVTYFISTPVSGWFSDHISRPHLVALSLALMTLSAVCFALRRRFGMLAFNISIGLLGTSMGVAGSSSQSLLADLVDRNNIGSYSMAYALSDVADSLGLIIGPIVGLFLSQHFGASSGVLSVATLCILLTPTILRIKS